MSLARTAQETLQVIDRGAYSAPSGREVAIGLDLDAARAGTVVYRPEEVDELMSALTTSASAGMQVEVTTETTAEAGRRLVQNEQVSRVVALNFASAKNPGGGFLGGAKAQEEDLARCSGLYACL